MLHAFGGYLLQAVLNGMIQRRTNPHVKPAANKRQSKRFTRQLREFDTNPAQNAFARLEDYTRWLRELLERTPFPAKTAGFGSVHLGVMLQQTVA